MSQTLRTLGLVALLLALALPMYALGNRAREQRASWPIEENYVALPPPGAARWSYLGYNELAADVTWSRMLVYYGAGFLGEGDFRYLGKFVDNIIALDPRFKKLYEWASYTVTMTSERKIATDGEQILHSIRILERAMEEFPDDYEFFWLAGIRYFLDMKSEDEDTQRAYKMKGAEYLELAMSKPNAPQDLAQQAASFRSQLGQFEQARANLMQMVMTTDDPRAQAVMLESFEGLGGTELMDELQQASDDFKELRLEHMQQVNPHLFVLLGGPGEDGAIEFDELATDRDLVGAESEELDLFP